MLAQEAGDPGPDLGSASDLLNQLENVTSTLLPKILKNEKRKSGTVFMVLLPAPPIQDFKLTVRCTDPLFQVISTPPKPLPPLRVSATQVTFL